MLVLGAFWIGAALLVLVGLSSLGAGWAQISWCWLGSTLLVLVGLSSLGAGWGELSWCWLGSALLELVVLVVLLVVVRVLVKQNKTILIFILQAFHCSGVLAVRSRLGACSMGCLLRC